MKREFREGEANAVLRIKAHRQYTYKTTRNSLEYFNLHLSGKSGDEFVIKSLDESTTPLTTVNEIIMVGSKNLSADISHENRSVTGSNKTKNIFLSIQNEQLSSASAQNLQSDCRLFDESA